MAAALVRHYSQRAASCGLTRLSDVGQLLPQCRRDPSVAIAVISSENKPHG